MTSTFLMAGGRQNRKTGAADPPEWRVPARPGPIATSSSPASACGQSARVNCGLRRSPSIRSVRMPSVASDCARLTASVVLPSLSSAEVTRTTLTGCRPHRALKGEANGADRFGEKRAGLVDRVAHQGRLQRRRQQLRGLRVIAAEFAACRAWRGAASSRAPISGTAASAGTPEMASACSSVLMRPSR